MFENLISEILIYMFDKFLTLPDLLSMRSTCITFRNLASGDRINEWKRLYSETVSIKVNNMSNVRCHKGGRVGTRCPNHSQCTLKSHMLYGKKVDVIPENKKITNGFFKAYVKECQNPSYIQNHIRAKIVTLRNMQRDIRSMQRKNGLHTRKRRHSSFPSDQLSKCRIECNASLKILDDKYVALGNVIMFTKFKTTTNEGKFWCDRGDMLLESVGLNEKKILPLKKKTKIQEFEERFAALSEQLLDKEK